jgi:hypothetical protein
MRPASMSSRTKDTPPACTSCAELEWTRFPKAPLEVLHGNRRNETIRTKRVNLLDLIETKKKGCQPCFSIYRAIELLEGINVDGQKPRKNDSLAARIEPLAVHRSFNIVDIVLRNTSQPLEVFAYIRYRDPPDGENFVRLHFEIFAEQNCKCGSESHIARSAPIY